MSQRKQFLIVVLIIFSVLLALAVNFFFYLEDCLNSPNASKDPFRFNAMIIRFKKFDSVIAGSSLSQNFKCTEFDKITGGFSFKLTVPGCRISKTCMILESAIQHQKINSVLLDLHNSLLLQSAPPKSMQDLYFQNNAGFLCDIRDGISLWSISDRRKYYFDRMTNKEKPKKSLSRDDIYCWAADFPCGKAYLAHFISKTLRHNIPDDAICSPDCLKQNITEYLLPLFRKHPEVTFYLFLPPFTPFAYIDNEDWFLVRKAVFDNFLTLPNVRVFDFQGAAEICTNYDNYKDVTHFSAEISSWILNQIAENKYRVTPENRKDFEQRFLKMMSSFDREREVAEMKKYSREHPIR